MAISLDKVLAQVLKNQITILIVMRKGLNKMGAKFVSGSITETKKIIEEIEEPE